MNLRTYLMIKFAARTITQQELDYLFSPRGIAAMDKLKAIQDRNSKCNPDLVKRLKAVSVMKRHNMQHSLQGLVNRLGGRDKLIYAGYNQAGQEDKYRQNINPTPAPGLLPAYDDL